MFYHYILSDRTGTNRVHILASSRANALHQAECTTHCAGWRVDCILPADTFTLTEDGSVLAGVSAKGGGS